MSRKLVLVTALLFALLPLGASAAAGDAIGPILSSVYKNKPNRVSQIDVGMLGRGRMTVRLYLTSLGRYMQLQSGTSKYSVLKNATTLVVNDKTVVVPAGTKYWVYYKPSGPWWRQHTNVVVRVRNNTPYTDRGGKPHQLCVNFVVRANGQSSAGPWQGVEKYPNCLTTRQWLR